jgi:hypothetical protein
MSQRVNDVLSITQRMFPLGLWKDTAADAEGAAARAAKSAASGTSLRIRSPL